MEHEEITPGEVAEGLKAPGPPPQQQANVQELVGKLTAVAQTGLTVLTITLVLGKESREKPFTVEDLPDEISLQDLLEVRRRLAEE
jgi:hypothetical protein